MVELRVDSVVDGTRTHGQTHGQNRRRQTCVSRTYTRLTALGRTAIIALGWCCMFQMFHSPPRTRARDPPFIAATLTRTIARKDRALCKAFSKRASAAPTLMHLVERWRWGETLETRNMSATRSHEKLRASKKGRRC